MFFNACPGLMKKKDCRFFNQEYRVWAKQNKTTDYRREEETKKKRSRTVAKKGSGVSLSKKIIIKKNGDGGKMASRSDTLRAEVLNKEIEVKRQTVDMTGCEKRDMDFKRNVARNDSFTCSYCQGCGHSTDK